MTTTPKPPRNRRLIDFAEVFRDNVAQGHILGAATIILLHKRRFMVEIVGEAERDPVLVRGALQSLNDLLAVMVKQHRDVDTTL